MQKILLTVMSLLLISGCFSSDTYKTDVSFNDTGDDVISVAEEYRQAQIDGGEKQWEDYELIEKRELFDIDGNTVAFSLDYSNGKDNAYIIVTAVDWNEGYVVSESSLYTASPYHDVKEDSICLYYGPFNYYSRKAGNESLTVTNLETGESGSFNKEISPYTIQPEHRLESRSTLSYSVTNVYLLSYPNLFSKISQLPSYQACVPTSFAMAVKYLHNTGQIILSDVSNIHTRDNMAIAMCGSVGCKATGTQPKTGIESFSNAYSNRYISTSIYDFYPDTHFSVAKSEIDGNYPLIVIFNGGVIENTYDTHATTMVGYQIITTLAGTINNYIRVVDPLTSTPVERTVYWSIGNSSSVGNVFGYFLLYVY